LPDTVVHICSHSIQELREDCEFAFAAL
jgi:hypothetical protein